MWNVVLSLFQFFLSICLLSNYKQLWWKQLCRIPLWHTWCKEADECRFKNDLDVPLRSRWRSVCPWVNFQLKEVRVDAGKENLGLESWEFEIGDKGGEHAQKHFIFLSMFSIFSAVLPLPSRCSLNGIDTQWPWEHSSGEADERKSTAHSEPGADVKQHSQKVSLWLSWAQRQSRAEHQNQQPDWSRTWWWSEASSRSENLPPAGGQTVCGPPRISGHDPRSCGVSHPNTGAQLLTLLMTPAMTSTPSWRSSGDHRRNKWLQKIVSGRFPVALRSSGWWLKERHHGCKRPRWVSSVGCRCFCISCTMCVLCGTQYLWAFFLFLFIFKKIESSKYKQQLLAFRFSYLHFCLSNISRNF